MIRLLGGEVMAPADGEPLPFAQTLAPFSIEDVIVRQPDVILIVRHGGGDPADRLADLPGWSKLDAVARGRVHFIDEQIYLVNPGLSVIEGVRHLRGLLYPNEGKAAAADD
jgi:ABC-type Fe3+-hydroxamate transport system substrate-binding protein